MISPEVRFIKSVDLSDGLAVTHKGHTEAAFFRPEMSLLEIADELRNLSIRLERIHKAERMKPRYIYVSAGTINEAREYFKKYFAENIYEGAVHLTYINSVEALTGLTDIELHVLPTTPNNVARFIPLRSHAIKVRFV